jgi:DNA-binding transcriptional LysR family regulator
LPSSGRRIAWLFNDGNLPCEILAQSAYVCFDDVLGGVTLARHGAGLFQTCRFIAERSLVEVLQPYAGRSRPFTLLYPHGRHVPLRLRAFIDFLMDKQKG